MLYNKFEYCILYKNIYVNGILLHTSDDFLLSFGDNFDLLCLRHTSLLWLKPPFSPPLTPMIFFCLFHNFCYVLPTLCFGTVIKNRRIYYVHALEQIIFLNNISLLDDGFLRTLLPNNGLCIILAVRLPYQLVNADLFCHPPSPEHSMLGFFVYVSCLFIANDCKRDILKLLKHLKKLQTF